MGLQRETEKNSGEEREWRRKRKKRAVKGERVTVNHHVQDAQENEKQEGRFEDEGASKYTVEFRVGKAGDSN